MDALVISRFVLERLDNYVAKLFLNEFIVTSLRDDMTEDQLQDHQSRMLGMRALCVVDEHIRDRLEHLILRADLILENLILWGEIAVAAKVLKEIPEIRNNDMLIQYGKKALSTDKDRIALSPKNNDIILIGEEENDAPLRLQHQFPQAPSMLLAKSILDQCTEPGRAGEALLGMVESISTAPSISRESRVALIEKMVQYCKFCFLKDVEGQEQLGICDSILSRIELLKVLILFNLN